MTQQEPQAAAEAPAATSQTTRSQAAPPLPSRAPQAPQSYALLERSSSWGRVIWTGVLAFVGLLLAGMILIPGRSGVSGAGALAQVLDKVDQLATAAVSPRPIFEARP